MTKKILGVPAWLILLGGGAGLYFLYRKAEESRAAKEVAFNQATNIVNKFVPPFAR